MDKVLGFRRMNPALPACTTTGTLISNCMKTRLRHLLPLLLACFPIAHAAPAPRLAIYPPPPGAAVSKAITLRAGGQDVPVLAFKGSSNKEEFRHATFSFAGRVTIEVTAPGKLDSPVIRPAGYGITGSVSGNTFRFTLSEPRNLVFEMKGQPRLFIFANPPEVSAPRQSGRGVSNLVTDLAADATGTRDVTDKLQQAIDGISACGGGVVYVPRGTYLTRRFWLKSGVHLYLEGGACLRFTGTSSGLDREFTKHDPRYPKEGCPGGYFIRATGGKNIRISGRGIIDCNGEQLYEKDKWIISALRPMQVERFSVEGVIVTDSTSWTVVPGFCRKVDIRNLKILNSGRRPQNDGIDPIGCQDVRVVHCFVQTNDDAFCPKPGGAGTHGGGIRPGPAGELRDVSFRDCVAITNCAAFKLGLQSSVNATNISFVDSYALSCRRACVIERNGGESTTTRNVLFRNIGVECEPRTGNLWVAITAKGRGTIQNVIFDRVRMQGGASSRLIGLDDRADISQVAFQNCTWAGNPVKDAKSGHINTRFVNDLNFTP